jgi:nucleoside-diphosphate-sugar epimerase
MRIFVAGGTGAIGRPLVAALATAGHEVVVFSRHAGGVAALGLPNVVPAVGDALDADALTAAVRAATPDVVVNQLTNLPQSVNPLAVKRGFDATSRLRREVAGTLVAAARVAGTRRVVAQSISFAYRPGPGVRTEADPLWTDVGGQVGVLTGSLAALETATLGDDDVEGVVLRYGSFYGAGTYFAPGGLYVSLIAKRRLPIPGDGGGLFGLVHIDDAVAATVAALEGPTGVFNVVDDVPAPASEWMPLVAALLGAKPPRRVPEALARIGAGKFLAYLMCDQPAVSNARARRQLGWAPRYPDWHEGLPAVLAGDAPGRRPAP